MSGISERVKNRLKIRNHSRSLLAYMAGLIDGEGCYSISFSRPRKLNHSTHVYCSLSISGTNQELAQWLLLHAGGNVTWTHKASPKLKDSFRWRVFGPSAFRLSEMVLPFLVVKKPQALVFKAWTEAVKILSLEQKTGHWRGTKLPQEAIEKRFEFKRQLHVLNKKGKKVPQSSVAQLETSNLAG